MQTQKEEMTRRNWLATISLAGALPETMLADFPERIRVGILGLDGHIGEIVAARRTVPQLQIVALSDSNSGLLREVGDRLEVPRERRYASHVALLRNQSLDIAGVCGSDGERENLVLQCIAQGIHVIAEKPLAMTLDGVTRIRTALAGSHVQLTTLLEMRYGGPFLAMRQFVRDGAIGEVAQIDAQKSYILGKRPSWMLHSASFSGTIPYIGIHLVDLMRFTGIKELTRVAAFQGHVGQPEAGDMENTAAVSFRLANGGTADMHLDYLRPENSKSHGDDRLRLAGTKGILEYREHTGLLLSNEAHESQLISQLPADRSLVVDFLLSLYRKQTPLLTPNDIFRANAIVFTAREAAEREATLPIPGYE